jgi:hypothetical protein
VADIVEIEPASLCIIPVKHAVITDAQSALGTSGQPMVRIGCESHAHFVHLPLDGFLDCGGKLVKGFATGVRPDLERSAHRKSGLAGAILAGRNLSAGLFKLDLDLLRKLKLVFEELIEPQLEVRQLLRGKPRDSGLDFLHCAHADILPPLRDM